MSFVDFNCSILIDFSLTCSTNFFFGQKLVEQT